MKTWNKTFLYTVLLASALLVSCVTETETNGSFKKPTPEGLNRAMSLYIQLAYQQLENKDYEKAMANVKRALDIDKNAPTALNALAVVYQTQGDTDKARKTFKKTLANDEKFSEGHLNYGQFLMQQKEHAAACKQFQMAADDDFYKKRSTAYFYLAVCNKALGDVVKSEAALNRCIGLEPSYTQAIGMLANIKFEQKKYPEAKQLFDRHVAEVRAAKQTLSPEALWLGIRLERVFNNRDAEASLALFLKNNYPYSKEYLEYKDSLKK